jgi:hypothetical protein
MNVGIQQQPTKIAGFFMIHKAKGFIIRSNSAFGRRFARSGGPCRRQNWPVTRPRVNVPRDAARLDCAASFDSHAAGRGVI